MGVFYSTETLGRRGLGLAAAAMALWGFAATAQALDCCQRSGRKPAKPAVPAPSATPATAARGGPETLIDNPAAPMGQQWTLPFDHRIERIWFAPKEFELPFVYVLDDGGYLTAVRQVDDRRSDRLRAGVPAWRLSLGGSVTGEPAFTAGGMYLCVGSRLAGLNPVTGVGYWQIPLPFAPGAGPAAIEDAADFDITDDEEEAEAEAKAKANTDISKADAIAAAGAKRGKDLLVVIPSIDRGIYGLAIDTRVVKFEESRPGLAKSVVTEFPRTDANIIWRRPTSSSVAGTVAATSHFIYFAESAGAIRGFDFVTPRAEPFGVEKTQLPVSTGPTLIGNVAVQPSQDGSLYGFFVRDMVRLWRLPLGGRLGTSPQFLTRPDGAVVALAKADNGPLYVVGIEPGVRLDGKTAASSSQRVRQLWRWNNAHAAVGRVVANEEVYRQAVDWSDVARNIQAYVKRGDATPPDPVQVRDVNLSYAQETLRTLAQASEPPSSGVVANILAAARQNARASLNAIACDDLVLLLNDGGASLSAYRVADLTDDAASLPVDCGRENDDSDQQIVEERKKLEECLERNAGDAKKQAACRLAARRPAWTVPLAAAITRHADSVDSPVVVVARGNRLYGLEINQ